MPPVAPTAVHVQPSPPMSLFRPLSWLLSASLACEAGAAPAPPPSPAQAPATPAPATPAPAPPATTTHGRYKQTAGIDYLEILHVAPGTPKDKAPTADSELPLIISIHGRGDTPEGFKDLLDGLGVHARVIVPRAFDPLGDDGFSWFPTRARSGDVAAPAAGIDSAGDRLAVLIDALLKTRPTRGRAIVTGFSQGGMLSFVLAVDHPDLVAAAVPVGGYLPPPLYPKALPPAPVPPIDALHGEADPVVPFAPTREAVDALKKQGWPARLHPFPDVAHQIPQQVRSELYTVLKRAVEALP